MKILMLAALVFAPMQQQVDPCVMSPTSFPPPTATACPPPGLMSWDCVYLCDSNYSKAMARANKIHCNRVRVIIAQYELDRFECNAAYDTCIYAGNPPSECASIRDQCTYEAGQTAVTNLDAADATLAAAEATARATHAGCTAMCCQQQ